MKITTSYSIGDTFKVSKSLNGFVKGKIYTIDYVQVIITPTKQEEHYGCNGYNWIGFDKSLPVFQTIKIIAKGK